MPLMLAILQYVQKLISVVRPVLALVILERLNTVANSRQQMRTGFHRLLTKLLVGISKVFLATSHIRSKLNEETRSI
jgi:hypothetical protein